MATPVIATTSTYASASASNSHTVNLPSGINDGDLLVAGVSWHRQSSNSPSISGWTKFGDYANASNNMGLAIFYKEASSEGSSVSLAISGSASDAACWVGRITGAEAVATQAPEVGTAATGNSSAPNPPSVTPAGGSDDYLYIAFSSLADLGGHTTNGDTDFVNLVSALGSFIACLAKSHNSSTGTTTYDPPAFGVDGGDTRQWVTQTVAITPSAGGGGTAVPVFWHHYRTLKH